MQELIARIAHRKWEQAGKPKGRDIEFWLEAEREVRNRIPPVVHVFTVLD